MIDGDDGRCWARHRRQAPAPCKAGRRPFYSKKKKSRTAGSLRDAVPLLWTPLPVACSTAISQADCRPTNIESGLEACLNVTLDAFHTSTGGAPFLKRQCGQRNAIGQGADVVLLCAPRCRGAMPLGSSPSRFNSMFQSAPLVAEGRCSSPVTSGSTGTKCSHCANLLPMSEIQSYAKRLRAE